eukprot:272752-Prymnesium_polylepis.1
MSSIPAHFSMLDIVEIDLDEVLPEPAEAEGTRSQANTRVIRSPLAASRPAKFQRLPGTEADALSGLTEVVPR